MEININNKKFIIVLALFSFLNEINADLNESLKNNFVRPLTATTNLNAPKRNDVLELVNEFNISYDNIVILEKNRLVKLPDNIAMDKELTNKNNRVLLLGKKEYIQITEKDGSKKLFQGYFLIKFENLPDFEVFAFNNNIIFVSDLSDIKRGVFKIDNLFNLEEVLTNLLKDPNIINIELNTIDPDIKIR